MAKNFGIDVSEHNGNIDWKTVKPHISFAMLRAGYGSKTADLKFKENATACTNLKIPFGVYWFSYAVSEESAKKEAKKCLSVIKPFKLSCPVAFDFEDDSLRYARDRGINISPNKMCAIASAFLDTIIEAGYPVLLYTNPNFWYYKGFKNLGDKYPIWCAHWGVDKPGVYCSVWQDSCTGKVEGISGNVDTDVSYITFSSPDEWDEKLAKLNEVYSEYSRKYYEVALEIIEGKYGNGDTRIAKLREAGLDYRFAQSIVNIII